VARDEHLLRILWNEYLLRICRKDPVQIRCRFSVAVRGPTGEIEGFCGLSSDVLNLQARFRC